MIVYSLFRNVRKINDYADTLSFIEKLKIPLLDYKIQFFIKSDHRLLWLQAIHGYLPRKGNGGYPGKGCHQDDGPEDVCKSEHTHLHTTEEPHGL